jgi:ElaB/YqjD/DUF883 family membrane-anchored ribosome-binding protein
MMDHETIRVAQEVEEAKARFSSSLGAVKHRLTPKNLAREAIDKAKERASDTAQASVDKVKANPSTAIGVAAAAILLLFRKPIFGAMKRLSKEKTND